MPPYIFRKGKGGSIMKKVISLALSLFLAFSAFSVTAAAEDVPVTEPGSPALYSMKGEDATPDFIEKIEENGVDVSDESLIELVPIETTSRSLNVGNALVITNENADTVTKDVLVLVNDDITGFETDTPPSPRASISADFPPQSWDGRYVVHGTAVFTRIASGLIAPYAQPISANFSYKIEDNSCTVSRIELLYICDGFEYSYPELENLHLPEIEYVITVARSNPAQNTTYSTSRPYTTERAIMFASGSPFVGQYLTFNTTTNTGPNNYTVKL